MRHCIGIASLLILAAGVQAPAAAQRRLAKDEIGRIGTRDLAARLLGPELGATIAKHELLPPLFEGGAPSAARLFGAPRAADGGVCRRDVYYVPLQKSEDAAAIEAGPPAAGVQIALAPECRLPPGGSFAQVQPATALEGAAAALRWLAAVRNEANRSGRPALPVTCRSDYGQSCAGGPQPVLAALPIEAAYIIEAVRTGTRSGWRFSIMPRGPGQLFWDTFVDSGASGPRIELHWRAPAPF